LKKKFIKDIKEKDSVVGPFLVVRKETGISKSGKAYLNLKFMDSTGEIEARVWDDAEELGRGFNKNDVVSIKGFGVAYQGGVQLNVSAVKALAEGSYSLRDFLPSSERDQASLESELDTRLASMKDRHLLALMDSIFTDAEIRAKFLIAPAAKAMHHPYLGGLAEHVFSICGLVDLVAGHYGATVNRDLLLSGAMLHDIGKIYELTYERSFDYSDEGRLLGHITMGVELIDRKLAGLPDFPRELAVLLKHMILSHHGQLEFGSPKRPKTIEAIILSYLDDLDAKVNTVRSLLKGKAEGANWTPYQKLFERYIYTGAVPSHEEASPPSEEKTAEAVDDNGRGTMSLFK
jgi:3'-5' exoribonuclease